MRLTGVGHSWWGLDFYQENDGINFGSDGSIDDLFTADCTIECWVKIPVMPAASATYILTKSDGGVTVGWRMFVSVATSVIAFDAQFATNDILIVGSVALPSDTWRHVALDFDFGTLTARLFVQGALSGTDTAVGAFQSGAAQNLICNGIIGVGTVDANMSIGPVRLSTTRRYTGASFTPPQPPHWPTNDANAALITRMSDGSGVVATDYSGNGNNGAITFGATTRWYNDPNIRL
jgi:hypothetical protein